MTVQNKISLAFNLMVKNNEPFGDVHMKFGAKEGHNICTRSVCTAVCAYGSEVMSNKFSIMYTHCVPK